MCGLLMASDSAIECALSHSSERGIALDSSWRHLNQNGCPLTLVTVVDGNEHMQPDKLRFLHRFLDLWACADGLPAVLLTSEYAVAAFVTEGLNASILNVCFCHGSRFSESRSHDFKGI
jgi:hypothetical protein